MIKYAESKRAVVKVRTTDLKAKKGAFSGRKMTQPGAMKPGNKIRRMKPT